jgi:hypothetical protein
VNTLTNKVNVLCTINVLGFGGCPS